PRNPAFRPTFDTLTDDPIAQAFALSASTGNPMPNIPQMGSVWGPLGDNLLLVRNGEATAADAMS
ncbi:MAG: maltose ABC transporter substrate-binding protein, partial [Actinobacteria bacterium]|nr:maltose ABC transporter substrate-binding protein [Actinomycetota bacterium]NIS36107.1 maltose ABC transporter substrate-binding protein [Actinomycetota bacterium]NIT98530.1 maltose ABC transporter substrate-binding protein [Actinomycetota bacterium]NIU70681.1 maltose ABC transporter substrate-binding protein [Actinomycetota bacterium]NIW32586.1 maltose ABC transporter substrate-binding protein [Actinomycetota bacterium]